MQIQEHPPTAEPAAVPPHSETGHATVDGGSRRFPWRGAVAALAVGVTAVAGVAVYAANTDSEAPTLSQAYDNAEVNRAVTASEIGQASGELGLAYNDAEVDRAATASAAAGTVTPSPSSLGSDYDQAEQDRMVHAAGTAGSTNGLSDAYDEAEQNRLAESTEAGG